MKKRILAFLAFGIVSVLMVVCLAGPSMAAEFSASMAISSAQGGEMTGNVYVKGNWMRQDLNTPTGVQSVIVNPENNVMYVLFPEQSVYMEMENQQVTLDESETLETKLADVADVKKLGKEKVQGFTCIKYLVTYHDPNAGKSTIWVSEKLNYPLKIYSESPQDTVTITYYDVVIGKVNPSLFEIPDGYEKMDMKMLY